MWLADDLLSPSSGVTAIVVAAISALATVLAVILRHRRPDSESDEAVSAGVDAATSAMADALVRKDRENKRLETLLDEAYQAGFKPKDRPRPGDGTDD